MDWQKLINGKCHYTDIPKEIQKEIKTERQWAKEGYVPKFENSGTYLYSNWHHNGRFKYLHKNEVCEATKEELDAFFADERKKKNERAKKLRLAREKEREREVMKLRNDLGSALMELYNGRRSFRESCRELCSNHQEFDVKTSNTIVLDIETTGFDSTKDELLQVSIIDGINGDTVFNSYIKPSFLSEWKEAENVNGISPQMVQDAPQVFSVLPLINHIVSKAETVITYGGNFDIGFLKEFGAEFSSVKSYVDVMEDFAVIYGDWDEYHHGFKWQKLSKCADLLGYDWGEDKAHDSLSDCKATLYCYNELQKEAYQQRYDENMLMYSEEM